MNPADDISYYAKDNLEKEFEARKKMSKEEKLALARDEIDEINTSDLDKTDDDFMEGITF